MAKARAAAKKIKVALSRRDLVVGLSLFTSLLIATFFRSLLAIPFVILLAICATAFFRERKAKSVAERTTGEVNQRSTNIEQFVPLLGNWPWDKKRFTHVGGKHPFDGIQLTDDALLFIEIKTGKAVDRSVGGDEALIRRHIREQRIAWRLVGLREDGALVIRDEKDALIPSG